MALGYYMNYFRHAWIEGTKERGFLKNMKARHFHWKMREVST